MLERTYRQPYSFDARNSSIAKRARDAGPDRVQRQRALRAVSASSSRRRRRARRRSRRRRRRCPTSAACSSASTTTSPSCPTSRCARASPTTASATSRTSRFDYTQRHDADAARQLRQALAPGEEGSRAPRCRSRSSRSSSGSTATSRSATAQPIDRRRARVEQGVREDRLQGRDAGEDPARRRRLRHARRAPRVDPLDDRPRGRRSAASARRQVDPRTGEILDADIGIDPVRLRNRALPARRADRRSPSPPCVHRRPRSASASCADYARRRSAASRSTCSRRAARSSRTAPRPRHSCSPT